MPNNFFIVGLPRSRTAWLSAFLTTNYTYCYHEAFKYCESIDDLHKLVNRDDYLYVGNSDSGLIHIDIGRNFPDAKVVMIERDVYEVADSMINLVGHDPGEALDRYSEYKKDMHNAIRYCNNLIKVDYNDINDKLEDIWTHCIGKGFDKNRAEHLIELNIQANWLNDKKVLSLFKKMIKLQERG